MFRASLCPSLGDRLYRTASGVSLDVLAAVVCRQDTSSARVLTTHNRYKYTLRIRDIYCFSAAVMVARTRLNVKFFLHCTSCLNLQLQIHDIISKFYFFSFCQYLPEDGRKRPKHVGGLLYDCIFLYRTLVQFDMILTVHRR